MASTAVTVEGRVLNFPVEVRDASSWAALYAVRAEAAARLVAHTGLEVAQPFPGRALLNLAFVRYRDSDLFAYNEFAVGIAVRLHDARPAGAWAKAGEAARGRIGIYIHRLPVDQTFTLAAGREIWGYPKVLAEIDIAETHVGARCRLRLDDEDVLTLRVHAGRIPLPGRTPPTYSHLEGVTRRTDWTLNGATTARAGGAVLTLGTHAVADELRGLGLPKRALMTTVSPQYSARFDPPTLIE
jgi:acetoacetate decarboxylase